VVVRLVVGDAVVVVTGDGESVVVVTGVEDFYSA